MGKINELQFPREKVLNILKDNLDTHKTEYEQSLNGWAKKLKTRITYWNDRLIQDQLPDAVGEIIEGLPKPVCYSKDYVTAIGMLELADDSHITLTVSEYKQYIQDEWSWQVSFKTMATGYAV